MIGGKLMRLSLMLVKSLVFDFRRERERLFLVFPFFAVCLHVFCSLFACLGCAITTQPFLFVQSLVRLV